VQTCARHLLALINDILDFSKIEAGKLAVESIETAIAEVVGEATDLVEHQAKAKGLTLGQTIAPDVPPVIRSDPQRLRQLLINLLGNAVKFTERGGVRIRVELDRDPDALPRGATDGSAVAVRFSVIDTGIGIPRHKRNTIFESFVQADGATTRKYGGTGLGLSICQRLVGLLGGRIWLESEVGRGSAFHFTVPVCDAQVAAVSDAAPAGEAESEEARPAAATVVLADEDDGRAARRAETLRAEGISVFLCDNGRDALDMTEKEQPDVLLLSPTLPVMDGHTVASIVRSLHPDTPAILALAEDVSEEACAASHASGCDGHVATDGDDRELIDRIWELVLRDPQESEAALA
jgi:CheY-like chemotaxis protein